MKNIWLYLRNQVNVENRKQQRNLSIPENILLGVFNVRSTSPKKPVRNSMPNIMPKDKMEKTWERLLKTKNDEKRKRKARRSSTNNTGHLSNNDSMNPDLASTNRYYQNYQNPRTNVRFVVIVDEDETQYNDNQYDQYDLTEYKSTLDNDNSDNDVSFKFIFGLFL